MFSERDWIKGTYQSYNDPTEWNGTNPSCKLCDNEIEYMDEYCEDHQPCIMCNEREECDCKEEMSQRSACCDAQWDEDTSRCYRCKEWTDNAWDDEVYRLKQWAKHERLKNQKDD